MAAQTGQRSLCEQTPSSREASTTQLVGAHEGNAAFVSRLSQAGKPVYAACGSRRVATQLVVSSTAACGAQKVELPAQNWPEGLWRVGDQVACKGDDPRIAAEPRARANVEANSGGLCTDSMVVRMIAEPFMVDHPGDKSIEDSMVEAAPGLKADASALCGGQHSSPAIASLVVGPASKADLLVKQVGGYPSASADDPVHGETRGAGIAASVRPSSLPRSAPFDGTSCGRKSRKSGRKSGSLVAEQVRDTGGERTAESPGIAVQSHGDALRTQGALDSLEGSRSTAHAVSQIRDTRARRLIELMRSELECGIPISSNDEKLLQSESPVSSDDENW